MVSSPPGMNSTEIEYGQHTISKLYLALNQFLSFGDLNEKKLPFKINICQFYYP